MKISNRRYITRLAWYLTFFIPVIVLVMLFQFLLTKKVDTIIIAFGLLLIAIIRTVYLLSYIEFENSGYVLTVKKRHPFASKGIVFPILEFPLDLLKECDIKKHSLLLIVENSQGSKTHQFKILMEGFTSEQKNKILTSFPTVRKSDVKSVDFINNEHFALADS